jgi:hypothetical protein
MKKNAVILTVLAIVRAALATGIANRLPAGRMPPRTARTPKGGASLGSMASLLIARTQEAGACFPVRAVAGVVADFVAAPDEEHPCRQAPPVPASCIGTPWAL